MSNDHPKMLFRFGSQMIWDGKRLDCVVAESEAHEQELKADGWLASDEVVKVVLDEPKSEPAKVDETVHDDNAPPTRDELERKARELGIKFDGRWGDRRLADAIEAKLKD